MVNIDIQNTTFDDLMRHAFVISFNDCKLAIMRRTFELAGIETMPVKYEAYHNKNVSGPYNCSLSHAGIVKMAQCMDLPFVVIFEDDAYPCSGFTEKFNMYIKQLPADANLLMLGYCGNRTKKPISIDKIVKTPEFTYGSHAYVLFKSGYSEYLKRYAETAHDKTVNADGMLWRMSKSYCIGKPLFIQYSFNESMNGHSGYIFFGNFKNPPAGFSEIDRQILIDRPGLSILLKRIARSYCIDKKTDKTACAIFGKLGDAEMPDCPYVVRALSKTPQKADLYVSYESAKNKFEPGADRMFIRHDDILEISKKCLLPAEKWLSTVFVYMLLALEIFDKVYVKNVISDGSPHHDPAYERILLDMLKNGPYREKLVEFI